MTQDVVKRFEELTAEIEEIRITKASWDREKKDLEAEFEELKAKVKEEYGVSLEDFDGAIKDLEKEIEEKTALLEAKLKEFKEKTQQEQ